MKENNNNTIYKYSQLYDILLEKILANEWKANDKMPTERELSIRYNVSRVTVRDTLNRLAQAGYIYRIQGKGTFVSVRKIEKKLTKLYTLRKRFEEKGVVHEVKTLQFEVISPSDEGGWRIPLRIDPTHVLGVALDEEAAGFDLIAHQHREGLVGRGGVLDVHLLQNAVLGVHGGLP